GWCRRMAPSCDPSTCVPGKPRAEMCNAFDDDCDGVIDNGPNLCAEGLTCYQGYCLTSSQVADAAAAMEPMPEPSSSESDGGTDPQEHARERPSLGCSLTGGAAVPWLAVLALGLVVMVRRRRR